MKYSLYKFDIKTPRNRIYMTGFTIWTGKFFGVMFLVFGFGFSIEFINDELK